MKDKFLVRWRYALVLTLAAGLLAANCKKDDSPTNSGPPPSGITVFNFTTANQSFSVPTGGGAVQAKLTGGTLPYTITVLPNASVATVAARNDTITVTPVAPGSTSVTIRDSSPEMGDTPPQAVVIGINVAVPSAFTVTVGAGTTPQYSWTVGGVFIVFVERTSDPGNPGWGIMCQGSSTTCITSPVTHGTTPAGTTLTSNREMTLTPGVRYRVTVYPAPGGNSGYADFTP